MRENRSPENAGRPTVDATGIDYLHLLEQAHQADVGQTINYLALADGDIEQSRHDQDRQQNT
jgi:hypothetical protein